MKLAVLGTGHMGFPMARRLAAAGHEVHAWNRSPDKAAPLAAHGVAVHASLADAVRAADAVVSLLENGPVVASVLFEQGAADAMHAGALFIDMASIKPAEAREHARRLAERGGVHHLDAPVSGGTVGAEAGTLAIMAGGEAEVFQRVKPLFEALGRNIVHVGGHGAGQVVKACNQVVISLTMEGVAEAILLARNNGVDPARMREALMGGYANSKILEVHGQRMLEANYKAGFKVKLHHKDMSIVMDNAHENHTPLPGAEVVARQIAALMEAGEAELDSAAIMLALERLAQAAGS